MNTVLGLIDVARPFVIGILVWIATGSSFLGIAAMLALQAVQYSARSIVDAIKLLKR